MDHSSTTLAFTESDTGSGLSEICFPTSLRNDWTVMKFSYCTAECLNAHNAVSDPLLSVVVRSSAKMTEQCGSLIPSRRMDLFSLLSSRRKFGWDWGRLECLEFCTVSIWRFSHPRHACVGIRRFRIYPGSLSTGHIYIVIYIYGTDLLPAVIFYKKTAVGRQWLYWDVTCVVEGFFIDSDCRGLVEFESRVIRHFSKMVDWNRK